MLLQANDPIYDLIDKEGQPAAMNPRERWAARRSASNGAMLGSKSFRGGPGGVGGGPMSSRSSTRFSTSGGRGGGWRMATKRPTPPESDGPMQARIEQLTTMVMEMKGKLEGLVPGSNNNSNEKRFTAPFTKDKGGSSKSIM